jgi:hypothetical protein
MSTEMLMLRQFFGGEGGYLSVVIAVGLFLIVIYRRDTIAVPALFRLGMIFYALSIAIPPFILPLVSYIHGRNPVMGRNLASGSDGAFWYMIGNATGPVLQGLTLLCAFNAIMPRIIGRKPEAPIIPQKHPLDD